jgi:biotin carboxyl carrier protein
MRRYSLRVNETEHVIDVEELARDTFTVHLDDGRLVDVVLTDHQDLAQAAITPHLQIGQPRPAATTPIVRDQPPVPAAGAGAARRPAPGRASGSKSVTAPMPGVVLSVDVAVGDTVQRGQTLLVLEAMKMKNELKAERDGVVATIPAKAGDQVKHGDVLLEFES